MFTLGYASSEAEYRVEVRRLDDLLEERGVHRVDLIKIDIEGSEYRALRGAARTLLKHKPTLLIELNEEALQRCQSSASDVKRLLYESGYRGWLIGRSTVRPVPETQETHGCEECLFVHRDKGSLLRELGLSD
jgi:hypothetical protein